LPRQACDNPGDLAGAIAVHSEQDAAEHHRIIRVELPGDVGNEPVRGLFRVLVSPSCDGGAGTLKFGGLPVAVSHGSALPSAADPQRELQPVRRRPGKHVPGAALACRLPPVVSAADIPGVPPVQPERLQDLGLTDLRRAGVPFGAICDCPSHGGRLPHHRVPTW
jgi:hypothetical protein